MAPKAKTYPERLGDWVKQRKASQRDKNLVAFLAVKHDVEAALEAGFAAWTIWENLREEGRIQFGYDAFRNHVKRRIGKTVKLKATAVINKPSESTNTLQKQDSKLETPAGFHFNAVPNIEELI